MIVGSIMYLLGFLQNFKYVDSQPEILITVLDSPEDEIVLIRLESNVVFDCGYHYELRASFQNTDQATRIQLDGLYLKKDRFLVSCRLFGRIRPQFLFNIGEIKDNESHNLIFTIDDKVLGPRLNKYVLIRKDGLLNINPKDGGFTSIIAYEKEGVVDLYSEKYRKDFYETETFQGQSYITY